MKNKTLAVLSILVISLIALSGCKKSEPQHDHSQHDDSEHAMAEVAETAVDTASAAEQTTCPVMGGKINKDIFVEYEGKKVYFCCAGCEGKFNAEPDKYTALLPQFK
jgi:YHS domain-containing protein